MTGVSESSQQSSNLKDEGDKWDWHTRNRQRKVAWPLRVFLEYRFYLLLK
ncbi:MULTISPECIES: hypothetical protein [Photorhabdus]|nr:hypothetical protein [Photorhabdus asymbiotica]